MAVVCGATVELYLVLHSHLPLPTSFSFPIKLLFRAAFLLIIQNHHIHIVSISSTVSAAHMSFSDT